MPQVAVDLNGNEFDRDGRLLVDWAVLSTAFCRETRDWLLRGGDEERAHMAWLMLCQFVREEGLAPGSMFDYSADVADSLVSVNRTDAAIDRDAALRREIRLAVPVVVEFRMLLSADSNRERAADIERLRGLIENWQTERQSSGTA